MRIGFLKINSKFLKNFWNSFSGFWTPSTHKKIFGSKITYSFLYTQRAKCPFDPQKMLFRGFFYKMSLKRPDESSWQTLTMNLNYLAWISMRRYGKLSLDLVPAKYGFKKNIFKFNLFFWFFNHFYNWFIHNLTLTRDTFLELGKCSKFG